MAAVGLLVGKVALVTGGGSGIGRAVCQVLAKEGARLAVVDINQHNAMETSTKLAGEHQFHTCDVVDRAQVNNLMEDVQNYFKQVPNILVNCAGITRDGFLLKMSDDDWNQVLDTNLKGTFLTTQLLAQRMVASKTSGSIVNLSSIVGKTGNIGQANYAASKAGVIGFTKTTAMELARYGIRCNAVLPGFIETPMTSSVPEKVATGLKTLIPARRFGKPEEVAEACLFLASDNSSYITGTTIEVSGGLFS